VRSNVGLDGDAAIAPTLEPTFAKPKSRIFAWPRLVTKMLGGLMSRWTMPCPGGQCQRNELRRERPRVIRDRRQG
jgi:hypothetical protein